MIYNRDEVYQATLRYFRGDTLAANTFFKYCLKDKEGQFHEQTPDDMHRRLAKEFARIEKKYEHPMDEEYIYSFLRDFRYIVPQGSPMMGIGNNFVNLSLSNCVVVASPQDSISSIMDAGKDLANLFKRRCGVGLDISDLRPDGQAVSNAAGTTSGAWSFADFYSFVCRMIGQNGRRGALMIAMDIRHPDILKFINMKRDLTKVTGANISVKLTDDFMQAVVEDKDYIQFWPLTPNQSGKISRSVNAREVWEEIVKAATETAEPGLLFWDNATKSLPAHEYEDFRTVCVNPCAELMLSAYDSCRLISINLKHLVSDPFTKNAHFDAAKFQEVAAVAQRLSDDLVDLELEKIDRMIGSVDEEDEKVLWGKLRDACANGRRTGLGTHGLADALACLNLRYDSDEGLEMIDFIYRILKETAYMTSAKLAKERGSFPVFNWEKEKDNLFIRSLPNEITEEMMKYGRRNISILTNAPTGSVSILSQTSSGIEPVFRNSYTRRKKKNHDEKPADTDYIDTVGDRWVEYPVYHHNVKEYMDLHILEKDKEGNSLPLPDFFVTSEEINWERRVEIQSVIQSHIDHSISSCVAAGNHLVSTSSGLRYVEEFCGDTEKAFSEPKESLSTRNHLDQLVSIDEGYNNGESQCVKLVLDYNQSIIATPNHKLFVLDMSDPSYKGVWKRMDQIQQGDFVIGRMGLGNFGDSQKTIASILGAFSHTVRESNNCKNISLPNRMNKDFARFLGYMISDGSVNENGCSLSQLKNNVVDDFVSLAQKIFSISPRIAEDNRAENLCSVQVNSRILRDYLQNYIGITRDCGTKHIPSIIFKAAGRAQTIEFIKGLTLDGHVSENSVSPLTTISKRLAYEVQSLLLEFGIECGIYENSAGERMFPSGSTYKTKKSYTLTCSGVNANKFVDLIGFAEERKQQESVRKFKRTSRRRISGLIPNIGIRERIRKDLLPNIKSNRAYDYLHSFSSSSKNDLDIERDNLLFLKDLGFDTPEHLTDLTYRFVKVKQVADGGMHKTYDLHIKSGNSYLVNGIISHNTINLPRGTSPEVVGKLYQLAWQKGLKGVTVYVDGSRDGVLITEPTAKKEEFQYIDAPSRGESLECDIHNVSVKGEGWVILVGLKDGKPYEVFGGLSENIEIPPNYKKGTLTKINEKKRKPSRYDLELNGLKIKDVIKIFDNPTYQVHTRMVSLALRHGAKPSFLVEQLQKDPDNDLTSFSKVLSRVLKKYVADGTKVSGSSTCQDCGGELIYQDGCVICNDCGWSKCG
jgi:ribonucleoside-diphosphate reductase alpha chain